MKRNVAYLWVSRLWLLGQHFWWTTNPYFKVLRSSAHLCCISVCSERTDSSFYSEEISSLRTFAPTSHPICCVKKPWINGYVTDVAKQRRPAEVKAGLKKDTALADQHWRFQMMGPESAWQAGTSKMTKYKWVLIMLSTGLLIGEIHEITQRTSCTVHQQCLFWLSMLSNICSKNNTCTAVQKSFLTSQCLTGVRLVSTGTSSFKLPTYLLFFPHRINILPLHSQANQTRQQRNRNRYKFTQTC